MSKTSPVHVLIDNLQARTSGLACRRHRELRVEVSEQMLLSEAEAFLRFVVAYLDRQRDPIRAGETLAYGYWITKFQSDSSRFLDVWEMNAEGTAYVPGATLTLTYWRDQHEVCARHGAPFVPPRPDQMAAVSAGLLEGQPAMGVRYPCPAHMSGWWLTTDWYDGDVRSLRLEHLYHVTAARPDIARYVALPYGFRFCLANTEHAWFDEKVASEPPE